MVSASGRIGGRESDENVCYACDEDMGGFLLVRIGLWSDI